MFGRNPTCSYVKPVVTRGFTVHRGNNTARSDKVQAFDGSRNVVANVKVNEYVYGKSMRCCAGNNERSPVDRTAPHFAQIFSTVAHSYFPISSSRLAVLFTRILVYICFD
jgi:hypothetical protein